MAYAALTSLAQTIENILPNEQDYVSFCDQHHMNSLHQHIISLQKFLEDVPMKFTSVTGELECQLSAAVYQVEDLIESNVKGSPCELMLAERLSPSEFYGCIEKVGSVLEEANKMKELFKQTTDTSAPVSSTPSSSIVQSISNNANVGLDDSFNKIVERVTTGSKTREIIPIVGMGGIGKTTLAKAVYESLSKEGHFDVCSWVTISQEYNTRDILLQLLGEKTGSAEDLGSVNLRVHQRLYHKRFLIVLDDMWDADAWNGVMTAIPDDKNGSRVILTTRLSGVASSVSSSSIQYQMPLLDENQSWDLLLEKVTQDQIPNAITGRETCLPEFEVVGRRIAGNCKGLPLTIVVIGGLLKTNRTEDYWEEVERNINEASAEVGELDAVLSLSYNNLPPHLKSCFLYMGAYPEDSSIYAEQLIDLWVGEGFVKVQAAKRPEEIAEEYLDDLVERSLVLVWKNTYDGRIERCGIHDVLRELSIKKAKEHKFLHNFTDRDFLDGVNFQNRIMCERRVSVSTENPFSFSDDDTCNTSTRSLLHMDRSEKQELPLLVTARYRLLKVLYGWSICGDSAFSNICELTNLRFLHLYLGGYCYNTVVVPESISNLQQLEVLTLVDVSRLDLPADIWKIRKLRHISVPSGCTTLDFPTEVSEDYPPVLQHLEGATNVKFMLSEILILQNLNTLAIHCKGYFSNYGRMYGLKNIVYLSQLETLSLKANPQWFVHQALLRTDFAFPQSLKNLYLEGEEIIEWEQMSSLVGSLPCLEFLQLKDNSAIGDTWKPKDGEFLQLKCLEISYSHLEHWLAESTHFPCLKKLVLKGLRHLEEIPLDLGYITTLHTLNVKRCSSKVNESAKRIRDEQLDNENHVLQVRIK